MSSERASIFDTDDLDVSDFQVSVPTAKPKPDKDAIRKTAEKRGFTSREPANAPSTPLDTRQPRRHTTGRNRQLNLKVTDDALARFYAVADARGWVLGETFEHAVGALERELHGSKGAA